MAREETGSKCIEIDDLEVCMDNGRCLFIMNLEGCVDYTYWYEDYLDNDFEITDVEATDFHIYDYENEELGEYELDFKKDFSKKEQEELRDYLEEVILEEFNKEF